jgi:hypothetical protein
MAQSPKIKFHIIHTKNKMVKVITILIHMNLIREMTE